MTTMSQGNRKIAIRKIPSANNRFGLYRYFALFQEILATNYKIFVSTGTGTRDRSFLKINIAIIENGEGSF